MSRENVEIARKAIEAWNAGDMDALRDLYDPAAVMRQPSDWLGGPWVGRDAIMQQFREMRDIWPDDSSFGRPELLDAGDRLFALDGSHAAPWERHGNERTPNGAVLSGAQRFVSGLFKPNPASPSEAR